MNKNDVNNALLAGFIAGIYVVLFNVFIGYWTPDPTVLLYSFLTGFMITGVAFIVSANYIFHKEPWNTWITGIIAAVFYWLFTLTQPVEGTMFLTISAGIITVLAIYTAKLAKPGGRKK